MYGLSTSKETSISTNVTNESNQCEPAIYGGRIVWTDDYPNSNGYPNTDAYMCTVSGENTDLETEQQPK